MEKRGLTQADVVRRSEMAGYSISQSQLWRIATGERLAGPDACISIAVALRIPREEVFRARGWLRGEPEDLINPDAAPQVKHAINRLQGLPQGSQERAATAIDALLDAMEAEIRRNDPELAARVDRKLSNEQQEAEDANNGLHG